MDVNTSFIIPSADNAAQKARSSTNSTAKTSPVVVEANRASGVVRTTDNPDVIDGADQFRQQATYDQPSGRSQQALASYQSFDREEKRAELRNLLGVDLFA